MMEEFPEEDRYFALPGFVKGNPKNNPIYLHRCMENYPEWADILKEIDDYLEGVLPGYNISQIKSKFGGLRFYWSAPAGADDETIIEAREAVWEMESRAKVAPPNKVW